MSGRFAWAGCGRCMRLNSMHFCKKYPEQEPSLCYCFVKYLSVPATVLLLSQCPPRCWGCSSCGGRRRCEVGASARRRYLHSVLVVAGTVAAAAGAADAESAPAPADARRCCGAGGPPLPWLHQCGAAFPGSNNTPTALSTSTCCTQYPVLVLNCSLQSRSAARTSRAQKNQ